MRCMELCVDPVLNRWRIEHLIQNPDIYGKKLFLHYADLVMIPLFVEYFQKLKLMSSIILLVKAMWGSVLKYMEVTTKEIANCTLKLLEHTECRRKPHQRFIWHAPQKSEILRMFAL